MPSLPPFRRGSNPCPFPRWFGPGLESPLAVVIKDWATDPLTRGCPIGVWAAGALLEAAHELRKPCADGRIIWAGEPRQTGTTVLGGPSRKRWGVALRLGNEF
jgi:hypothetical protein